MRGMKSCVHGRTQDKSAPGRKQRRQPEANFLSEKSLRLKPDVAQLQKTCPTVLSSGKRKNFYKKWAVSTLYWASSIKHSAKLRSDYGEIPLDPLKKKILLFRGRLILRSKKKTLAQHFKEGDGVCFSWKQYLPKSFLFPLRITIKKADDYLWSVAVKHQTRKDWLCCRMIVPRLGYVSVNYRFYSKLNELLHVQYCALREL